MENLYITITIAIAFVIVMGVTGDVGKARAEAAKECYKAAQVNTSVKCEGAN